jgi:hypothetical protein
LWWVFWERVSQTICPILLSSASWVAGITGVSHQHLASNIFYCVTPVLASFPSWVEM